MSLATSYAKALYEAAKQTGADAGALDRIDQQMESFHLILKESNELRKALFGPVATIKEKIGILESIGAKVSYDKIFQQFLVLLTNKGRLSSFEQIRDAFSSVRLEAEGGAAGKIMSADPLSDQDVQELADAFSRKLGKRVAFRVDTDPSLLAGLRVVINGTTYDGSLRTQLQRLRDSVVAKAATT